MIVSCGYKKEYGRRSFSSTQLRQDLIVCSLVHTSIAIAITHLTQQKADMISIESVDAVSSEGTMA